MPLEPVASGSGGSALSFQGVRSAGMSSTSRPATMGVDVASRAGRPISAASVRPTMRA